MKFLFVLIAAIAIFNANPSIAQQARSRLYVGNLAWHTTDESLREAFSLYGEVLDATVTKDRETGRSKGFGFVLFSNPEDAQSAIEGLNNNEFEGRRIKVKFS